MNAVLSFLARIAVGKHLLAGLAKLHNLLDGHKSELLLAVLALVHLLKLAEVLPAAVAEPIEVGISGALGPAIMARAKKVMDLVDGAVPGAGEAKP